jgi:hypothetical protein
MTKETYGIARFYTGQVGRTRQSLLLLNFEGQEYGFFTCPCGSENYLIADSTRLDEMRAVIQRGRATTIKLDENSRDVASRLVEKARQASSPGSVSEGVNEFLATLSIA